MLYTTQTPNSTLRGLALGFFRSLPRRPYCASHPSGFEIGRIKTCSIEARKEAVLRPYVQLNTPGTIRYLIVNLCAQPNKAAFIGSAFCRGHEPLAFVWESAGLRCPTITTVVSSRLLVQFIWELESPVTTSPNGRSRREPIRFLHNTLGTLAHELGGKFVSSRPPALALNPLHSDFQTSGANVATRLKNWLRAFRRMRPR